MAQDDEDYWERVGTENPYWGVLSQDKFVGTDLDAAHKREFMAEGVRDIFHALSLIRHHVDPDFAPRNALDFGCGVGRLVLAMAPHAGHVTGIDVSQAMLARATANAAAAGVANARFTMDIPEEKFDWINSYIAFQHIAPRKGIALLGTLLSRLAEGGTVSLQFAIFRDARIWHRGLQESRFGRYDGETYVNFSRGALLEMPVYEYDLSEIICHLIAHGVENFGMSHTDHGGLHGVWIVGRKG